MPVRSPLTAYGNARVGPPAMSFVQSTYFSDSISAVLDMQHNHIHHSGRIGGDVFFERKRRKKSHRIVRPKRVFNETHE
jgi:hypothetical protein